MAEQFAGLTLGVDINQVNKAVKSLQEFKKANDDAASGVKILKKALLLLVKQNKWLATKTGRRVRSDKGRNSNVKCASLSRSQKTLITYGRRSYSQAEQFAGLTLGVDINQVNKAVKSLQEFKKANDDAASGVKILKKALLLLVKQNKWLATKTGRRVRSDKGRNSNVKCASLSRSQKTLITYGRRSYSQ
ncbi:putative minor tail fiber protein [Salmonella virus STSR3]|nr:putative minor tail fiber protein [Salmonella virus STSR3]